MSDTATTDIATTIDAYFAMWNEDDRATRAEHIARAWADDAHYVDPLLEAKGHAELVDMVDGVHAQFPGYRFRRTSGVDAHHALVRFTWDLAAPDGTIAVAGTDIGVVADDGRLSRIAGFFGDVPASL